MKGKKIVLTVIVCAMLLGAMLMFTACNNATPQGQLANFVSPHTHEQFVYDVKDTKDNSTGTYTVTLDALKKDDAIEDFDGLEKAPTDGILIRGNLVFGSSKYVTGCYIAVTSGTSYMVPTHSFRVQSTDDVEDFRLKASYTAGVFYYTRTVGDKKDDGQLKLKGTFFDNNEFQQTLRALTTFSSGVGMSFVVPIASKNEAEAVTVTVRSGDNANVKTEFTNSYEQYVENGVSCYVLSLSRSTKVASKAVQTLYYATENVLVDGWPVKNMLLKFVEPYKNKADGKSYNIEYTLKSATIIAA